MNTAPDIRNEAIAASAGTGKTYQLALRYLSLLTAGVAPEAIVALTFSRKAAGEIFDRIIQLLANWIDSGTAPGDDGNADAFPAVDTSGLIARMRSFISHLHMLPIGTIDSFFVRIIRAFPFEFGLSGEFEIIDDLLLTQARDRVFRHILWSTASATDTTGFLEEFKQATFGREEKRLHKLLHDFIEANHTRYLATLESGYWGNRSAIWPQGNNLQSALIDTQAAVKTLRATLNKRTDLTKRAAWDAFLDEADGFGPASALSKSARLFDDNLLGARELLEKNICDIKGYNKGKNNLACDEKECRVLSGLIGHIVACQIENALIRSRGMYEILRHYELSYEKLFRSSGKLTFDDIVYLLSPAGYRRNARVLSHGLSQENKLYIDYRLDSRYAHWLLDEFQDTSRAQWAVLKNLIDEVMQSSDGTKSFFYVGDIKQAIYGWRGGDARLFTSVHKDLQARFGNFSLRHLSDSWRSGPAVIETVEKVFGGVAQGMPGAIPSGFLQKWPWIKHSTKMPKLTGCAALYEVAKQAGESSREMLEKRARIIADKLECIQPSSRGLSAAILTRTNKAAQAYAQYLESRGIRTALEGSVSLYDNDMVKAMLSLIKFAQHPADSFAWHHIQMSPLATIARNASQTTLALLDDIHEHGFAYVIRRALDKYLAHTNETLNPFGRQRMRELLSAAQRFDETGNRNCLDFIDFIREYKLPAPARSAAVQILTIHKAKGLEYDIVFMPELSGSKSIIKAQLTSGIQIKKDKQGNPQWAMLFPKRCIAEQNSVLASFIEELDEEAFYEELCVLYVGMTRAARALYMIADKRGKTAEAVHAADILRDTLAHDPEVHSRETETDMQCLYNCGDSVWYEKLTVEKSPTILHADAARLKIRFAKTVAATAPSRAEKRIMPLADIFTGKTHSAMHLGVAVHSLFEQVINLNVQNSSDIMQQWKSCADFDDDTIEAACALFKESLQSADVRRALSVDENKQRVWTERPFDVIIDKQWISGVFDRVTVEYDSAQNAVGATVLDYKTDAVENENTFDSIKAMYAPQLALYRKVLSKLEKIDTDKIVTQLVLVRTGAVISIDS